ncbi:MAG: marine proteobacterial sortase target protein [Gammaproteobacteria bacterium]|nr:marine proteobacterial sortase target protein [Gammaproteobacteria bacterium]
MNERQLTRPRVSDMFETQLDFFAPVANPAGRRPRGRALGRFATLLMLLLLLLLVIMLAARTVVASPEDEIGAGTLLFRSDADKFPAPLLKTEVDIAVSGMIARVDVRQSFHNPGNEHVEGIYVFPLPDDAAVDTLRLHVGDRLIVGEIKEKTEARKTYVKARESGKRASLIEQQRPNMFTTAVANIAPGETVEVEIAYLQTLRFVQGAFSIRFPMTVTPRYEPESTTTVLAATDAAPMVCCSVQDEPRLTPVAFHAPMEPGNQAKISVKIDAGFPLARLESLYHSMDTVQAGNVYLLTPDSGSVPMNRDLELVWQPALGSDPQAAVFAESWKGENFALIMVMPPETGAVSLSMSREVIYVIDTSGSMGGTSIEQARAALQFAIERLKPQDRFNIVRFASNATALFDYAVPADEAHKSNAIGFVQRLDANGGTDIAKALDLALDEQADIRASADGFLRQVVFVTDGSVGNEQQLFTKISNELGNTRLFTVGIGSAPNDWFMRKAAEFGRGTYTSIGGDHMIEERMDALLARLEQPVLRDIEIAAPSGASVWPEKIRDLYADEPVVVRAKLASPEGEFRLRGSQASLPWQKNLSLKRKQDNPGIAALWGRGKIEALMDSLVTGANPDQVRADVVRLALRHHLVSRYTSLVAVDHTPNRAPGTSLNSGLVPANTPSGSAMSGYPAGATPATLLALFGLLSLLLAAAGTLTGRRR